MPVKPPAKKVKEAKTDAWLSRIPAEKRPTKVNAQKALDTLEVVMGEPADDAKKRRGLKTR